jgi:hypothetical protein
MFEEWRIAYAKQALADLRPRERLLEHSDIPQCQQLHFLQMACEKLCKAFLCGQGETPEKLRQSHAYIAGTLPVVARQQFARESVYIDRTWIMKAIRSLARKIELLAPAVDDNGWSPANCEYPWAGPGGTVTVPAEFKFPMDFLYEDQGPRMLKLLFSAAEEMAMPAT